MDYHWIIMDYDWIIHELSLDYHGLHIRISTILMMMLHHSDSHIPHLDYIGLYRCHTWKSACHTLSNCLSCKWKIAPIALCLVFSSSTWTYIKYIPTQPVHFYRQVCKYIYIYRFVYAHIYVCTCACTCVCICNPRKYHAQISDICIWYMLQLSSLMSYQPLVNAEAPCFGGEWPSPSWAQTSIIVPGLFDLQMPWTCACEPNEGGFVRTISAKVIYHAQVSYMYYINAACKFGEKHYL